MSLFFCENQYFNKNNSIFCYRTGKKFLKFIVFIYLVLNLMLHYSSYIYPVVFTGILRALSNYENDVHIVNISNGSSIYNLL